jgi:cystathionine beta-lyase
VSDGLIRDLTDEQARASLLAKWGMAAEGVIPAWIAEMDYAPADCVTDALLEAVRRGVLGYPAFETDGGRVGQAYAGFAARHYGQTVEPGHVRPVVDVTAGVRLLLDVLSEPGPMVMPVPAYSPQLEIAQITGRERVDHFVDPDAPRAELDLDQLDRLLGDGAQTLLLTQPHNPWGRVFGRAELEGIRDVVTRHGARVISDEIHAPLVLPGAEHVSYLDLDGTADHAVALVAASKAFNTAGLKCAQLVIPDDATRKAIDDIPMARNDSWSSLGIVASVAAYQDGDAWLAALIERLDQQRTLLAALLAEHLPEARMRPLEATYLAWIDLRAYGHDNPAELALERGRVWLYEGHAFHPGLAGHVRLNIATSPARLAEIVRRLASAIT